VNVSADRRNCFFLIENPLNKDEDDENQNRFFVKKKLQSIFWNESSARFRSKFSTLPARAEALQGSRIMTITLNLFIFCNTE